MRKGRPTYVACWVAEERAKKIEVFMSDHMKMHHIEKQDNPLKVIIVTPNSEKVSYISPKNIIKLEAFLERYAEVPEVDKPTAWEELAKDRLARYKKSGLVLRGMRYRENISQKELAAKSGVNQNEISKIENGKRTVGEKVAKKLAKALNFNYKLLVDVPQSLCKEQYGKKKYKKNH